MSDIAELDLDLDHDLFLRELLRQLSGTLEDVVGLEEAEGYISVVGRAIGRQLDDHYRQAMGAERLDREHIAEVLVDLKRRIRGGFRIHAIEGSRIVLTNTACPFGDKVIDRPSLCMMTMNVFGTIAAQNNGQARVDITQAIARGDSGCRVVVDLSVGGEASASARDFFRTP